MTAVSRFLDLPTSKNRTAPAIFEKVNQIFISAGLSYDKLMCSNSDTSSTMKGQRKGVVRHLRNKQPNLIDLVFIYHLN